MSPLKSPARYAVTLTAILFALLAAPIPGLPQTGPPAPDFSALDAAMQQALTRYGVKGGALAVVKDGHLLFARGYGLADAEAGTPVQPDSLFRWGSISKTITATAVVRLVEDGKLDLDTPVLEYSQPVFAVQRKAGRQPPLQYHGAPVAPPHGRLGPRQKRRLHARRPHGGCVQRHPHRLPSVA